MFFKAVLAAFLGCCGCDSDSAGIAAAGFVFTILTLCANADNKAIRERNAAIGDGTSAIRGF